MFSKVQRFSASRKIVLAVLALAGGLWLQPYRPLVFVGASMNPTYENFSVTLTEPVNRPLQRGDVVVVNLPGRGRIVKRVAFVAGDVIRQYRTVAGWANLIGVREARHIKPDRIRSRAVADGEIFILGDNRDESEDSRIFGAVSMDRVERVVIAPRPAPPSDWKENRMAMR